MKRCFGIDLLKMMAWMIGIFRKSLYKEDKFGMGERWVKAI